MDVWQNTFCWKKEHTTRLYVVFHELKSGQDLAEEDVLFHLNESNSMFKEHYLHYLESQHYHHVESNVFWQ